MSRAQVLARYSIYPQHISEILFLSFILCKIRFFCGDCMLRKYINCQTKSLAQKCQLPSLLAQHLFFSPQPLKTAFLKVAFWSYFPLSFPLFLSQFRFSSSKLLLFDHSFFIFSLLLISVPQSSFFTLLPKYSLIVSCPCSETF